MLIQILKGTPTWVFVLFGALLVLGFLQSRTRKVGVRRILLLPAGFIVFSLYGVIAAFGAEPASLAAWGVGMAASVLALRSKGGGPELARWDAATRSFHVAGTWIPLALMMTVFFARYAIAVTLAMRPELRAEAMFALGASFTYGALTGLFVGRAISILATRPSEKATEKLASVQ